MQRSSPSLLLAACTLAACSGTQAPPPDTCGNVPASALVDRRGPRIPTTA